MIHALLSRLEFNPRALFLESELAGDREAFEQAKSDRMIVGAGLTDTVVVDGRLLSVHTDDEGRYEALDDDDPEFEPVRLEISDLRRWRVHVQRVVEAMRHVNSLEGASGELSTRFWLVGADADAAYVLAFLNDQCAARELQTLRSLLPAGLPRTTITMTPTYEPTLPLVLEAERLSVTIARMEASSGWRVPAMPVAQRQNGFRQSKDLLTATINGTTRTLTRAQGSVLHRLKVAFDEGLPDLTWSELKKAAMQANANPDSMRDVFKDRDLRDIFMREVRKGVYRLNVDT